VPVEYLHRDQVSEEIGQAAGQAYPCVLARVGGAWELLADRDSLEGCKGSLAGFKNRLLTQARSQKMDMPEFLAEA